MPLELLDVMTLMVDRNGNPLNSDYADRIQNDIKDAYTWLLPYQGLFDLQ